MTTLVEVADHQQKLAETWLADPNPDKKSREFLVSLADDLSIMNLTGTKGVLATRITMRARQVLGLTKADPPSVPAARRGVVVTVLDGEGRVRGSGACFKVFYDLDGSRIDGSRQQHDREGEAADIAWAAAIKDSIMNTDISDIVVNDYLMFRGLRTRLRERGWRVHIAAVETEL